MSWNCPKGQCRFCGGDIVEAGKINRRKHWHQPCADRWRLANRPAEARRFVLIRDNLVCQHCHERIGRPSLMEVDHDKPLYAAHGDFSYYEVENMVSLCRPCHAKKTKTDMERWRAIYG